MSYPKESTELEREQREALADCIGPNTPLCAGKPLSPDLHKKLLEVMAYSFTPDSVLKLIEPEIIILERNFSFLKSSMLNKYVSDFEIASKSAAVFLKKYRGSTGDFDPKFLDNIFTDFSNAAGRFILNLNRLLKEKDSEDRNASLCKAIVESIEIKLSTLTPDYRSPYNTSIASILHILTPRAEEYLRRAYHKDVEDRENSIFKPTKKYSLVEMALMAPQNEEIHYTSISPYLLRSLVTYADYIESIFLRDLPQVPFNQESIISELRNYQNNDASSLLHMLNERAFYLESDKQNVTITWQIPSWLLDSAQKNQKGLENMFAPIDNLMGAITPEQNNLSVDIIDGKISVRIKFPQGEPIEYESISEEDDENIRIFLANSDIPLLPQKTFRVLYEGKKGQQFYIMFSKESVDSPQKRETLIRTLENLETSSTKYPLKAIDLRVNNTVSTYIAFPLSNDNEKAPLSHNQSEKFPRDGEDYILFFTDDKKSEQYFRINSSLLLNKAYLAEITKIVDANICYSFIFPENARNLPLSGLQAFHQVLDKAKEINYGEEVNAIFIFDQYQMPGFEIFDSEGDLIARQFYLRDKNEFVGRMHSKELTYKLLGICRSIFDSHYMELNPCEFIASDTFIRELEKHNVYPTNNFKDFCRLFLEEKDDIEILGMDPRQQFLQQIQIGQVIIKEKKMSTGETIMFVDLLNQH